MQSLMGWSRREFLRRAAAAGVVVVPTGAALSGCATSGGGGGKKVASGKKSTSNPLGVNESASLDAYIFNGGYGHAYADADLKLYEKAYPKATNGSKVENGQQLGKALQPRFVGKNPPDIIDNSGDGNLDVANLIHNNQIADLTPLFNAPSIDDPKTKVKDTLLPRTVELGSFSGKPYILNYIYNVQGIWHSDSLFKKNSWEAPKTWADMMTLCAEIKKSAKKTSLYPWAFQGKFPTYILAPILVSAAKLGGVDVLKNIDNLESGAWTNDAVITAGDAYSQLVSKGYLLPGTQGLTHTQSQTYWARGKAAFIPCGSWLRNEIFAVTPKDFDMVVTPTPSLSSSDKLPYTAVQALAGEGFIVPADAKNPTGGMEFMRIMLGKAASTQFSKLTNSLTVLKGYANSGQLTDSSLTSANAVNQAAGSDTLYWNFGLWYAEAEKAVENATGQLMNGKMSAKEWAAACQKAADKAKSDSSLAHPHRA